MKRIIKEGDVFIPQYKSLFMRYNYFYDDMIHCGIISFYTMKEAKDFLYNKKEKREIVFNEEEIYNIDIGTPLIRMGIISIIIYFIIASIRC